MHAVERPEAIDTRLVFRVYTWIAVVGGFWVFSWGGSRERFPLPRVEEVDLPAVSWGRLSLFTLAAMVVVGAGCCASALAGTDNPVARRRALY